MHDPGLPDQAAPSLGRDNPAGGNGAGALEQAPSLHPRDLSGQAASFPSEVVREPLLTKVTLLAFENSGEYREVGSGQSRGSGDPSHDHSPDPFGRGLPRSPARGLKIGKTCSHDENHNRCVDMTTQRFHTVAMSTQRVVLITGGSSGIGLGLAQRYDAADDQVILTGRSPERLAQAQTLVPHSVVVAGDLSRASDRLRLAAQVGADFGRLDVLVNNAGIQRRVGIADDVADWPERQTEIDLLLSAPIHLSALFIPLLLSSSDGGQIINIISGGAYNPQPFAPTYSAAKAALHSYTMNLRGALTNTAVTVTELIPPAVATGLAGPGHAHGADLAEFCDTVFPRLQRREEVVGFGATDTPDFRARLASEDESYAATAQRFPVKQF